MLRILMRREDSEIKFTPLSLLPGKTYTMSVYAKSEKPGTEVDLINCWGEQKNI